MTIIGKIGIGFILTGIIMFFIMGSMFSYMGDISPTIKLIGEISFVLWLPSIVLGIILLLKKKNN
jgi:hypothetical protein